MAERVRITTHTTTDHPRLVIASLDDPSREQEMDFDTDEDATAWCDRMVERGEFTIAEQVWS